jgi:hypothetical protein
MKQILVVAIALIAALSSFGQDDPYYGTSKDWGYVKTENSKSIYESQKNFYSSDDTLFLSQVSNREYYKKYKDNYEFKFLKMPDGSVLSVGDEVTFGRPVGSNRVAQSNVGLSSGHISSVGAYSTMVVGRLGLSVMSGMQWLPDNVQGTKTKILEIKRGRLILGEKSAFCTVLGVDRAFESGELINPKRTMNKSEAIAKLKETKDLLDLGMIKLDEYERIKSELTPIILNNN